MANDEIRKPQDNAAMMNPTLKIYQKCIKPAKAIWSAIQYRYAPDKYLPAFFHDINNVGDQLTPYLVNSLHGKPAINIYSFDTPRMMAVGSILHYCSKETVIWGSGAISRELGCRNLLPEHVFALRGKLTMELVEHTLNRRMDCAIGDPAVLVPSVYSPHKKEPTHKFGLIPHYVDEKLARRLVSGLPQEIRRTVRVISVRQNPESFIDELHCCKGIFSSSLHGLILSDAYNIPNKWIEFSKNIIGDGFKFHDYYSSTQTTARQLPVCATTPQTLTKLLNEYESMAKVHCFNGDLLALRQSFFQAIETLQKSIDVGAKY